MHPGGLFGVIQNCGGGVLPSGGTIPVVDVPIEPVPVLPVPDVGLDEPNPPGWKGGTVGAGVVGFELPRLPGWNGGTDAEETTGGTTSISESIHEPRPLNCSRVPSERTITRRLSAPRQS